MSTLRANPAATPQDYVRQLRVGNHDVIEDQWRGESDAVNQVLLNNTAALAALNPGLLCVETVALLAAGATTSVTVSKPIATLVGGLGYLPAGIADSDGVNTLGITGLTADGDQVANPEVIALAGTSELGTMVVTYVAA